MGKIQKCTLSIIYPFTSYENAQAKAGITHLKQCSEDAYVNFVKIMSYSSLDNPISLQ